MSKRERSDWMSEYNWKNIRADKEGRYAEMAEHPPDEKTVQSMKRKPYQNVDVLGYLQKKYKIGGDTSGESKNDKREKVQRKQASVPRTISLLLTV